MAADRKITGGKVRIAAAMVFCLLVAAIVGAEAAASADGPEASTAVSKQLKQVKQLKQRAAQLQARVNALSRPQGPPGTAGADVGCRGNDASDVMVSAGPVCIDRYEVSIWDAP